MRICVSLLLALLLLAPLTTYGSKQADVETACRYVEVVSIERNPVRDEANEDSVLYHFGFEDGMGDWTSRDLTAPGFMWHLTETHAFEENSWWCADEELGGYDNHWLQYLEIPAMDLSQHAGEAITLTFKLYWAVEPPEGAEAPYNGWDGCNLWISTDGGESWDVLDPETPEYTSSSLYSFGQEWGMGPNIPGWTDTSGEWVDAEFDLSDYDDSDNVSVRFAFCSDPAWSTNDDENAYGMLVDNIQVTAGEEVIFDNNGDEQGDDEEMDFATGPTSGDYWEVTDEAAHDGELSVHCPIEADLQDALISPPLEIPEDPWYSYFDFYIHADARNFDPDEDNALDDYYMIEISEDGSRWEKIIHDYGRNEDWWRGFHYYGPDTSYNDAPDWKIKLNLTGFGGQTIWLRWKFITDANLEGNQGSGLWLDDIKINITQRREYDVAADYLHVPYPTAFGLTTPAKMSISNVGMLDFQQVQRYIKYNLNGDRRPAIPWEPLNSDSTKTYIIDLNSQRYPYPYAGKIDVVSYIEAVDDENPDNDMAIADSVVVYPEGVWVLGYDNRANPFAFNIDQGSGPCVYYSVEDDGIIDEAFDLVAIRQIWNGNIPQNQQAECVLHIFDDNDGRPGNEVYTQEVVVNSEDTFPLTHVLDLTGNDELINMDYNFWVWYEITQDDNLPSITGDEEHFGEGHYFTYDGENLDTIEREFYIHPVLMPTGADWMLLSAGYETVDFESVQPNERRRIAVPFFNGGNTDIEIREIAVEGDAFSARAGDFQTPHTLMIGDFVHVDVTFEPEQDSTEYEGTLTVTTNADNPTVVQLMGNGDATTSTPGDKTDLPVEFALGQAYPNPFNAQTVIPFTLPQAADVRLAVYDLSGRLIAELVNGRVNAGVHEITYNAENVSTGVYIYKLEAGSETANRKIVLIK